MALREFLLNIVVKGYIQANSFIKDGGLSTQFLKADGSIDSNTYLSSIPNLQQVTDVGATTTNPISITNGVNSLSLNSLTPSLRVISSTAWSRGYSAGSWDGTNDIGVATFGSYGNVSGMTYGYISSALTNSYSGADIKFKDGKVGINLTTSTSPLYNLHVNGDGAFLGLLTVNGGLSKTQGSTRVFDKVFQSYNNTTFTGIISIYFPQATISSTMFNVLIRVYGYQNKTLGELNVAFYKQNATTIHATSGIAGTSTSTDSFPTDVVKAGIDASGNVRINLGTSTTAWGQYLSYEVVKVETKFTGYSSDWSQGWTGDYLTAEPTDYATLVTLPVERIATRNWVATQIPGSQTLSLGANAGEISISGGNTISLPTLGRVGKPDADAESLVGFTSYVNSTGSTNYPNTVGGGFRYHRAAGTNWGAFDIWQTSTASGLTGPKFRFGNGVSSYSPWYTFASEEWVTSNTDSRFIGNGAANGSPLVQETGFDFNTIPNKSFTSWVSSTGVLNPPSDITLGGVLTHSYLSAGSGYGTDMFISGNADDQFIFRRRTNSATYSSWYRVASREWTNTNYVANTINLGSASTSVSGVDANAVTTTSQGYTVSPTNTPSSLGFLSSIIYATGGSQTWTNHQAPDAFYYRGKTAGVWGAWNQVASREWVTTQIPSTSDYVTTNTTQTGLSGDKTWTGQHIFGNGNIRLNSPSNNFTINKWQSGASYDDITDATLPPSFPFRSLTYAFAASGNFPFSPGFNHVQTIVPWTNATGNWQLIYPYSNSTTAKIMYRNGSSTAWNTPYTFASEEWVASQGYTSNTGTVTSVSAGNGMNFSTIIGVGAVTMGTPSPITATSTNNVTSTSHTHELAANAVTTAKIADGAVTDAKVTDVAWGKITGAPTFITENIATANLVIPATTSRTLSFPATSNFRILGTDGTNTTDFQMLSSVIQLSSMGVGLNLINLDASSNGINIRAGNNTAKLLTENLTATRNFQFPNASGTLALTSDLTSGTVTSVAMSVPTGLTISGSPITTSGTLNLGLAAGYSIPTTANQTNWTTAFGWGNHATAGYLTSVPVATATTIGGVELFSDTVQTVAATAVSTTAARTYGVQLNASGQAVVNVPWTDVNTTYTAGNGLTLTGTVFSLPVTVSGTGTYVQSVVQNTNGITVTLGTPPNTVYTGSTSITLSGTSFQRAALTGDVTAPANSNTTTIATNAVTYAKLQNQTGPGLLGKGTAGAGATTLVTVGSGLTLSTGNVLSADVITDTNISTTDLTTPVSTTRTLTVGTGGLFRIANSDVTSYVTVGGNGGDPDLRLKGAVGVVVENIAGTGIRLVTANSSGRLDTIGLASGQYNPSIISSSNTSGTPTFNSVTYVQIDRIVMVSGFINVAANTLTGITVTFSPPVATTTSEATGTVTGENISAAANFIDGSSGNIRINITPTVTTVSKRYFTLQYFLN